MNLINEMSVKKVNKEKQIRKERFLNDSDA